ncbi:MAG: hypothetical protein U5K56_13155 [Halioglobus sp.]|nr:hypothetical protein [Halioglobus sp.]
MRTGRALGSTSIRPVPFPRGVSRRARHIRRGRADSGRIEDAVDATQHLADLVLLPGAAQVGSRLSHTLHYAELSLVEFAAFNQPVEFSQFLLTLGE